MNKFDINVNSNHEEVIQEPVSAESTSVPIQKTRDDKSADHPRKQITRASFKMLDFDVTDLIEILQDFEKKKLILKIDNIRTLDKTELVRIIPDYALGRIFKTLVDKIRIKNYRESDLLNHKKSSYKILNTYSLGDIRRVAQVPRKNSMNKRDLILAILSDDSQEQLVLDHLKYSQSIQSSTATSEKRKRSQPDLTNISDNENASEENLKTKEEISKANKKTKTSSTGIEFSEKKKQDQTVSEEDLKRWRDELKAVEHNRALKVALEYMSKNGSMK